MCIIKGAGKVKMEIVNCFWDWMAQLSWRLFILMEEPNNPLCSLDKVLFSYFLRVNILFASVGLFSEKVFLKKELYDKLQNSSTRDFLVVVLLYASCVQVRVCFLDRFVCIFLLRLRTLCGDPYVSMHWWSVLCPSPSWWRSVLLNLLLFSQTWRNKLHICMWHYLT